MEHCYGSLQDPIHNVFIPIVLIFFMERKLLAWLTVLLMLSGCISQATEEQKYIQNHNISQKAAGCFNGDGNISVVEDTFGKSIGPLPHEYQDKLATAYNCNMTKIGAVVAYEDKPFFDDMMNTDSLKYFDTYVEINNSDPLLAEQMAKEGGPNSVYTRAREAGLGTLPAYVLSHKQLGSDESNIFKYIASFDSQAQIEAAKAYGVNLELNELEFLAKNSVAEKVLRDGYNETKDKYIEEVMKSFNAYLSKYLIRGALNDDGTMTQYDYQNLQWFEMAYKKMDPGIANKFNEIMEGNGIGTIESIGVTEDYLKDPYDSTLNVIPKGRKFYVQIDNPGDYVENGQRIIKINTGHEGYSKEVKIKNAKQKRYLFFDDPLVVSSKIDHIISDVDEQYYVVSDTIPGLTIDRSNANFYNFFDNYVGIGYETPIQITSYGSAITHEATGDERWWNTDIYIYIYDKDKHKHHVSLSSFPGAGRLSGSCYHLIFQDLPTGWYVQYDQDGNYMFGKENNKEYQDLYGRGDNLIIKLLPGLKQMKMRWYPI